MSNNELDEESPVVTEEYLLSHGFERYSEVDEGPYKIPFFNEDDFHFREKKFDRQMFVVIFSPYNGNAEDGYSKMVFVQEDAGCGFIEMPFPWWDLPIEYFESVYYGIRGHKPNRITI